ncbi:PulJ/GspJ family protein [Oceanobacillus bengalensis]|nr:prepilin-type N-terminal cleavage/methylation domain-containing protein [Oceanobacillus bengalensis]
MIRISWKNEHGVTLVELLAAVTIASIIGIVVYSLLNAGLNTYERVKVEAELRDEADYIMASMINELYTLKISEVNREDSTNKYIMLNNGAQIGFDDQNVIIGDREISLNNSKISISEETKILPSEEFGLEYYEITLVLEHEISEKLETESGIRLINDIGSEE